MKKLLLILLLTASGASAGILPLIHDRPRRDNPHDPASKPMELPIAPYWTPTPTATATPSCNSLTDTASVNTFESGAHGFIYENYAGPPPYQTGTYVQGTATACNGSQALCGTAPWSHGGVTAKIAYKRNPSPQNWSGKTTLSAWIYFPASGGDMRAKLYLKVTAGYTGYFGPETASGGGGWRILSYDISALPNLNDVREYGVDMYSNNGEPDGPHTVCIDSIHVQ